MTAEKSPGKLVVISGPSGSGKSTVLAHLLKDSPVPLSFSVSATTRPPRPKEVHGTDYYFLSPAEFASRRERGEFLECFQVYGRDYWYGTLWSEVNRGLEQGRWVVLEVDVQGAQAVRARFPDAITIFLRPPEVHDLERRLQERRTEKPDELANRLAAAQRELEQAHLYRYQIVNGIVADAVRDIQDVLRKELAATNRG